MNNNCNIVIILIIEINNNCKIVIILILEILLKHELHMQDTVTLCRISM